MGPSVRTDLLPGRQPVTHLRLIHQRLADISRALLPFIGFPDQVGNQELDCTKPMLLQNGECVFNNVPETIIESEEDSVDLDEVLKS